MIHGSSLVRVHPRDPTKKPSENSAGVVWTAQIRDAICMYNEIPRAILAIHIRNITRIHVFVFLGGLWVKKSAPKESMSTPSRIPSVACGRLVRAHVLRNSTGDLSKKLHKAGAITKTNPRRFRTLAAAIVSQCLRRLPNSFLRPKLNPTTRMLRMPIWSSRLRSHPRSALVPRIATEASPDV